MTRCQLDKIASPDADAASILRSKADPRRPVRVLLLQLPFFRLSAPSISLASLEAALVRAGVGCDLVHLSLDFGRRIGRERYTWIAVASPPYLLAGDLVFAPSLYGRPIEVERIAELVAGLGSRAEGELPPWFVTDFPELAAAAEAYLDHHLGAIAWQDYDLVGLSTINHVTPALALARRVKQLARAPAVVLGGSNCEGVMGEELHRAFPFVDYVCRGEGEELIVELARSFAVGERAAVARPGLVWREDGATRLETPRALGPGLDALPVPRYPRWLAEVRDTGLFSDSELQLPIETSRGCWYGERRTCLFCGLNGQGIAYRRKSAARILEELRGLMEYGVRVFHCVDNVLDPRYFDEILPALAELDHGCELFWPVRPTLSREQLALLARSGVCWIQAGLESLSTPVLQIMGKGTTALQNVRLLRHAAEVGVGTAWNVLYGFVGEPPGVYREMAALMPALAHLQPPRMSYPIRMDRFAPLHEQRKGVRDVAPARAYRYVFQFEPERVERLAYYFDYAYADQPDPLEYVAPCLDAMASWRREVGKAVLFSVDSGGVLHLRDTRAIATSRGAALRGVERELLLAARRGLDDDQLAARVASPARELEAARRELESRRWLERIDGKLLALPVPLDAWLPPGVPPALVLDELEGLYRRRMLSLHDASSGMKRPPRDAGEEPCP